MSRTLVIGNGFDLYQGYKTSYKDFLSFTNNLSLIKNDEITPFNMIPVMN